MRRHNFWGICDSDVWIDVSAVEKCVSVCARFSVCVHEYIDPLHCIEIVPERKCAVESVRAGGGVSLERFRIILYKC
jgi:hypothetical protein